MKHYLDYIGHDVLTTGKVKKIDETIYTFDIETTSYFVLNDIVRPASDYRFLSDDEKEQCTFSSTMYIWMFSINKDVYYGRTYEELEYFLNQLYKISPYEKHVFVHNLAYEFQFLKGYFKLSDVFARKKRRAMQCKLEEYNILFRCSLMLSNCSLAMIPKVFNLNIEKQVGKLDYNKIRTSITPLTYDELIYCEYDCLVLYEYIKFELGHYHKMKKIPKTSTGKVRREFLELIQYDFNYRYKVNKSINVDKDVYNLLVDTFTGGYTHANWLYTDEILENVDSYDLTSSYPFVMVVEKYPSTEFKKCVLKDFKDRNSNFAYLLVVKFKDIKSKYFNTFISKSKCKEIINGVYDNGRIMQADELTIPLTDLDMEFILKSHDYSEYEILESYYSLYDFLPKQYINFILSKYVAKTEYKGVAGKESEYMLEKNKFNALYGMTVTNMIRDEVIFENGEWEEIPLTNEEIDKKLNDEKTKSFLSFSYGVWVTAYARRNLLNTLIQLDEYAVYCDTDSIKLLDGYDKTVFKKYNEDIRNKVRLVSSILEIEYEKYAPFDKNGKQRLMGIFEHEKEKEDKYSYDEFITQGAKKYAYKVHDEISIVVSGVPKKAGKSLGNLSNFRDDWVFEWEDTNKHILSYQDNQDKQLVVDYFGQEYVCDDVSGICMLPTTYVLGKAQDYAILLNSNSSTRAKFR